MTTAGFLVHPTHSSSSSSAAARAPSPPPCLSRLPRSIALLLVLGRSQHSFEGHQSNRLPCGPRHKLSVNPAVSARGRLGLASEDEVGGILPAPSRIAFAANPRYTACRAQPKRQHAGEAGSRVQPAGVGRLFSAATCRASKGTESRGFRPANPPRDTPGAAWIPRHRSCRRLLGAVRVAGWGGAGAWYPGAGIRS